MLPWALFVMPKKNEETKEKVVKKVGKSGSGLQVFGGLVPSEHKQVIERPGYRVIIVRGDDQKTINEIQGTGKVIGAPRFEGSHSSDSDDEIVFVVLK